MEKRAFPEFRLSSLKFLRCLKLYSRGVVQCFDTIFYVIWFPFKFWYGHWLLIRCFPASTGTMIQLSSKPKSKLVGGRCNFCLVVGTCLCQVWVWPLVPLLELKWSGSWNNSSSRRCWNKPGATSVVLTSSDVQNPQWTKVYVWLLLWCFCVCVCIYIYTPVQHDLQLQVLALNVSNRKKHSPLSAVGLFLLMSLKSCGVRQAWLLVLKKAL